MELQILFDSNTENDSLSTGWGLSFLVDKKYLFDTGNSSENIMNNIDRLNVDLNYLNGIVISHEHEDHSGGIYGVVSKKANLKVWIGKDSNIEFKNKLTENNVKYFEVTNEFYIDEGIYSTGQLDGIYNSKYMAEQSLIVKTDKGISIITGCAHTNILNVIDKGLSMFPDEKIYAVVGGFHLKDKNERYIENILLELKKYNIKIIAPTHCTGVKGIQKINEIYKTRFFKVMVGSSIEL